MGFARCSAANSVSSTYGWDGDTVLDPPSRRRLSVSSSNALGSSGGRFRLGSDWPSFNSWAPAGSQLLKLGLVLGFCCVRHHSQKWNINKLTEWI